MPLPFRAVASAVHLRQEDTLPGIVPLGVLQTDESGNVTLTIPQLFIPIMGGWIRRLPSLRSMKAVSKQALRVLRALGNATSLRVTSTVGPEREYFLVDKKFYLERIDLMLAGRTIFGAPAPKGQELEDQYFWHYKRQGLPLYAGSEYRALEDGDYIPKPSTMRSHQQYEMAPVSQQREHSHRPQSTCHGNHAKGCFRNDLVCLLTRNLTQALTAPANTTTGLSTDDGINLLDPGHTPSENVQFLLFLSALLKAVVPPMLTF